VSQGVADAMMGSNLNLCFTARRANNYTYNRSNERTWMKILNGISSGSKIGTKIGTNWLVKTLQLLHINSYSVLKDRHYYGIFRPDRAVLVNADLPRWNVIKRLVIF
jgi:hypothetical protein